MIANISRLKSSFIVFIGTYFIGIFFDIFFNLSFWALTIEKSQILATPYFTTPEFIEIILQKWPIPIMRYAVISLVPAFSAMAFWYFFKKIPPISFVLAFLVITPLEWMYLGCIYCDHGVDGFLYARVDWFGLCPTCWCTKQLFDLKGRELAIEFTGKTKHFLKAISSGVLFLSIYLFVFTVTNIPQIISNDGINHRLPVWLYGYFFGGMFFVIITILLFRNKPLKMIKITRIAMCLNVIFAILYAALTIMTGESYLPHIEGNEFWTNFAIAKFVEFRADTLGIVCQTSATISLAFWITIKLLKTGKKYCRLSN